MEPCGGQRPGGRVVTHAEVRTLHRIRSHNGAVGTVGGAVGQRGV